MVESLGRERSFLFMPKDGPALRLPRGSLGLHTAFYTVPANQEQLPSALAPACNEVRGALQTLSPRLLLMRGEDGTSLDMATALPDAQKNHLLNLAQGKTKSYQCRGSLRSELRQLVSLGLLEKLPGRNIGDMQTGSSYDLADVVKLTDRGIRCVERILRRPARPEKESET